MVSALEHLCIPIDSGWNLDGNVFGTSCSTTVGLEAHHQNTPGFSVQANHWQETIEIFSAESAVFQLFDQQGRTIWTDRINSGKTSITSTALSNGVYFGQLVFADGLCSRKRFIVH